MLLAAAGEIPALGGNEVLHWPEDFADSDSLRARLARPAPEDIPRLKDLTIVFDRGVHEFPDALRVERDRVTLAGVGTIRSPDEAAVVVSNCRAVSIRGMGLESTSPSGRGLLLEGSPGPGFDGQVSDVTIEDCSFAGATGIRATVFVGGVTVDHCRFRVERPGGIGISWADGEGLFVSRCRFEAHEGAGAASAVEVRGAQDPQSEGNRAHRVILSGNRIGGDFATALDLADVLDLEAVGNRVSFRSALRAAGEGRVGIAVRHEAASSLPEEIVLQRNRVRGAHTGIWLVESGSALVARNDFRYCGSPVPDTAFHDSGCGLRLSSPRCPSVRVLRNDFRGLRSPAGQPAVRESPSGTAKSCFFPDDGNRLAGRPLREE
jgi:hypothetical protein